MAVYTVEPDRWMEVTAGLFNLLTSLRVLRRLEDEPKVVGELTTHMKDLGAASHKIDPPDDDVDFRGCHA